MENTDNTLLEMQQQMQQLREKLESQEIVNDRLIRKSCKNSITRLKIKSSVPAIAGFAGLALIPVIREAGFSDWFLGITGVLMLTAIGASTYVKRFIPHVDKDLLTSAEDVTRFRRINAAWIKFGLPTLVVWFGLFILDVWKNNPLLGDNILPFIGGISMGLVAGVLLGLKNRRDILRTSDELIAQIEELRKG